MKNRLFLALLLLLFAPVFSNPPWAEQMLDAKEIAREARLFLTALDGTPLNLRESSGLLTQGVIVTSEAAVQAAAIQTNWLKR